MSTTGDKAKRATMAVDPLSVDGLQMPDSSYRISQTQSAEIVGKLEINARRFLNSKGIKAPLGEIYTPDSIEVDFPNKGVVRFSSSATLV